MGYESYRELIRPLPPAAGTDFVYRIPGEVYSSIEIVKFTLTTSAAVANRVPGITYQDGDGNDFAQIYSSNTVVASSTITTTLSDSLCSDNYTASGASKGCIPHVLLPPGFKIRLDVVGIQAGDQISNVSIFVCRYPSGEWAESTGAVPYSPEVIGIIG